VASLGLDVARLEAARVAGRGHSLRFHDHPHNLQRNQLFTKTYDVTPTRMLYNKLVVQQICCTAGALGNLAVLGARSSISDGEVRFGVGEDGPPVPVIDRVHALRDTRPA
jgi:hypothetical protein